MSVIVCFFFLLMFSVEVLLNVVVVLLAIFVVALALTFVTHVWWGVPYVPTPMPIVRTMVQAAHLQSGNIVYDLGAGDARLLIEAKRMQQGIDARGCELVPTIWLLGWLRLLFSSVKVTFRCRSLYAENLSDADVIFLYLSPSVMQKLEAKFTTELKKGTRIISDCFCMKNREPVSIIDAPSFLWGKQKVYVYSW